MLCDQVPGGCPWSAGVVGPQTELDPVVRPHPYPPGRRLCC